MISMSRPSPARFTRMRFMQDKPSPMLIREVRRQMLKAQIREDNKASQIMSRHKADPDWWEPGHKWKETQHG